MVRLGRHFQGQGIRRVDEEKPRNIVPALEAFRTADVGPPRLSAHFFEEFENIIQRVAVVGE